MNNELLNVVEAQQKTDVVVPAVETQQAAVETVLDPQKLTHQATALTPKRLTRVVTTALLSEW